MRILKFYGSSDDLFECEGTRPREGEPDEIGKFRQPAIVEIRTPDGEGLHVIGQYAVGETACWMIGIAPLEEDTPIPVWNISFGLHKSGYSPELTVEVPDSAFVRQAKEREDG